MSCGLGESTLQPAGPSIMTVGARWRHDVDLSARPFCVIEDVLAKLFVPTQGGAVPRGNVGGVRIKEDVIVDAAEGDFNLGDCFPLTNREDQCRQLIWCLWGLESLRCFGSMEARKRKVRIPVCTGMPGIGKTRWARAAILSLALAIAQRLGLGSSSAAEASSRPVPESAADLEAALAAVPTLVQQVWPEETEAVAVYATQAFVRQLLRASCTNRNLRLHLKLCDSQHVIALRLVAEWAKHLVPSGHRDSSHGSDDMVARVFGSLAAELRAGDVTVSDAIRYILHKAAADGVATADDDPPALIVNIDEAQQLPEDLLQVCINAFVGPLLTNNLRVYLTITGLSSGVVAGAFNAGGVQATNFALPLLEEDHMAQIIARVFSLQSASGIPDDLRRALWWLGGIPRFLDYFLMCASEKVSGRKTLSAVWTWLSNAGANDIMDVVQLTAVRSYSSLISGNGEQSGLPDGVLDNLVSLSVSGLRVPLCMPLSPVDPAWTLERAQRHQLLCWHGLPGGEGRVVVPPLILFKAHSNSRLPQSGGGQCVAPLKRPSATMSADEYEALVVSALLHKLRAAAIAKLTSVTLRELPGGELLDTRRDLPDVSLPVPLNFERETCSSQVTASNFSGVVRGVRAKLALNPASAPSAFINTRGAAFVDAFLVFPEFLVLVKEHRSPAARRQQAIGADVPPMPSNAPTTAYIEIKRAFKASSSARRTSSFTSPMRPWGSIGEQSTTHHDRTSKPVNSE